MTERRNTYQAAEPFQCIKLSINDCCCGFPKKWTDQLFTRLHHPPPAILSLTHSFIHVCPADQLRLLQQQQLAPPTAQSPAFQLCGVVDGAAQTAAGIHPFRCLCFKELAYLSPSIWHHVKLLWQIEKWAISSTGKPPVCFCNEACIQAASAAVGEGNNNDSGV